MATYKSDRAQAAISARMIHAGVVAEFASYNTSGTLSAGDVVQMVKVQAGGRLVGYQLSQLDEPVAVYLGDGIDKDRYSLTASTGPTVVLDQVRTVGVGYEYSADDTIDMIYWLGQSATGVNRYRMIAYIAYDS